MTVQNAAAPATPTTPPDSGAQGDENASPAGDDAAQGQDDGADGKKPKRDPFQRAINRQTRKYYEEKARADLLEKELERYRNGQGGAKPTEAAADPDAEPDPDDFTDPKEFTKALAKWTTRQELKTHSRKTETEKSESAHQEMEEAFAEREDQFRDENEDYDDARDALREARVRFPTTALEFIMDSEKGPALLRHLGLNLKVAKEIAAMSPTRAVAALTRLEDKLPAAAAKPEEKKKSGAPDPVTPVRNRATVEKKDDELTDEEWFAKRAAEKAKKKK
jgi:hypothetical protein